MTQELGNEEMMSAENPIDPISIETIRDLDEGAGDVLREIIDLFLRDAPSKIVRIQQAVDRSDAGEIAQGAHSLKGSAGNFGAHGLVALCARLEQLGKDGDIVKGPDLLRQVEQELDRVSSALKDEMMTEVR